MRNSSLVKRGCADNVTGLKPITEATGVGGVKSTDAVGERCQDEEASGEPGVET